MRMLLTALALSLLSSGCTSNTRQPATHDFGPEPRKTVTNNVKQKFAINVDAPSWLWDNRIRYRLLFAEPSQIRFYGQDVWIASPPELFQQKLVASSNTFKYRLLVKLETFEQQFDASDRARVILNFSVEAVSADNNNKIATQSFRLQQISTTPDAQGAIDGFANLTLQAVDKIQYWLKELPDSER